MINVDFNFLLLNHIPVKGNGYSPISNIHDDSLVATIRKQLEFNLEQLADKDNCSHSILNIQLLDKSRLVIYNTVFSLEHSDETGRQGIFFGIYLILEIKKFEISMLTEISSMLESYLEKIMDGHTLLKKKAKTIFKKESLIDEYTIINSDLLSDLNEFLKYKLENKRYALSTLNVFESLFENEDFKNLLEKKIFEIVSDKLSLKRRFFSIFRTILGHPL